MYLRAQVKLESTIVASSSAACSAASSAASLAANNLTDGCSASSHIAPCCVHPRADVHADVRVVVYCVG